mmetsp:Transcript_39182/g.95833  ORF Transcript_39182/g.95833 Transcript_39182/m.95833 type:complete len:244 (-) Transcript_39182:288-1019(-)
MTDCILRRQAGTVAVSRNFLVRVVGSQNLRDGAYGRLVLVGSARVVVVQATGFAWVTVAGGKVDGHDQGDLAASKNVVQKGWLLGTRGVRNDHFADVLTLEPNGNGRLARLGCTSVLGHITQHVGLGGLCVSAHLTDAYPARPHLHAQRPRGVAIIELLPRHLEALQRVPPGRLAHWRRGVHDGPLPPLACAQQAYGQRRRRNADLNLGYGQAQRDCALEARDFFDEERNCAFHASAAAVVER